MEWNRSGYAEVTSSYFSSEEPSSVSFYFSWNRTTWLQELYCLWLYSFWLLLTWLFWGRSKNSKSKFQMSSMKYISCFLEHSCCISILKIDGIQLKARLISGYWCRTTLYWYLSCSVWLICLINLVSSVFAYFKLIKKLVKCK